MHSIIGWDIGGAHVKAALMDKKGHIQQLFLEACPLWKGLESLHHAIKAILTKVPDQKIQHVITMTGELVDLFEDRDDGIRKIINSFQTIIGNHPVAIYAGQQGFIQVNAIKSTHYFDIASANWLASANWVAKSCNHALFVDIGSTTTDILLCENHQVDAQGISDYQRLKSGELVYTGIIRTAVMALTQSALFNHQNIHLMAEYFATTADVYRVTGDLNEAHDKTDTADGKAKTLHASAKRLSRMIGVDVKNHELNQWKAFALDLKFQQKQQITTACCRKLTKASNEKNISLIGAGVGRFLVKEIARDLGLVYQDFETLFKMKPQNLPYSLSDCAPAVAVAALFKNNSLIHNGAHVPI
ncbi:MAG: H4MPT-linked C1 transfer pathway protein [Methylococcales bacterium]|nr:H4MPT-linked C1 transfer pathway protein [Methylococcales bacterium]